jgi:hypothetical protein
MTWNEALRCAAAWLNRAFERGYSDADIATGV